MHCSFYRKYLGRWSCRYATGKEISKGLQAFLCVIDIYSKYAWFIPEEIKNVFQLLMLFKKHLDESNRKSSKVWVDKGSKYYNRSMKSLLQDNDIEMLSMDKE